MTNEEENKIKELRFKIEERISGRNATENEDTINIKDLKDILISEFGEYDSILLHQVEHEKDLLNRRIAKARIFKKKVPYIDSIVPSVYKDSDPKIIITFNEDGKIVGIASIDKGSELTIEYLKPNYDIKELIDILRKNKVNFLEYYNTLNKFSSEYPNINYEWSKENSNVYGSQVFDDGFIRVEVDLRNLNFTYAMLSKLSDYKLSRTNSPTYGELNDYIEFYNKNIMKSVVVNKDELNPLFRQAVKKSEERNKSQERTLRVK